MSSQTGGQNVKKEDVLPTGGHVAALLVYLRWDLHYKWAVSLKVIVIFPDPCWMPRTESCRSPVLSQSWRGAENKCRKSVFVPFNCFVPSYLSVLRHLTECVYQLGCRGSLIHVSLLVGEHQLVQLVRQVGGLGQPQVYRFGSWVPVQTLLILLSSWFVPVLLKLLSTLIPF